MRTLSSPSRCPPLYTRLLHGPAHVPSLPGCPPGDTQPHQTHGHCPWGGDTFRHHGGPLLTDSWVPVPGGPGSGVLREKAPAGQGQAAARRN